MTTVGYIDILRARLPVEMDRDSDARCVDGALAALASLGWLARQPSEAERLSVWSALNWPTTLELERAETDAPVLLWVLRAAGVVRALPDLEWELLDWREAVEGQRRGRIAMTFLPALPVERDARTEGPPICAEHHDPAGPHPFYDDPTSAARQGACRLGPLDPIHVG